ncbi:MAG: phosphatase PAP2 family protein [Bacteroidota bacterium]|nr:phosphatase PAP2 family protein [Bacteroidota bacterium]
MSTPVLLNSFLENAWEWLRYLDTRLFLKINTEWTSSFLDSVFPWYREANAWVPLYLFLIVFAFMNFKQKAIPWILFAVLTATLTDQISSSLIKNWIARPRPCRDELFMSQVRLILNNCSGGYSFPSSHATNHFGFAMFLFLTLRPILKQWVWLFFVWAATICYGQVYVGVHYPLDVLCGAILGTAIGYLTASFFNKKIGLSL